MDENLKAIQTDSAWMEAYYKKSISKTEQQKHLERMLEADGGHALVRDVADIACGGGTLTHHVRSIYPDASFTLLDYNDQALKYARELLEGPEYKFVEGDARALPFADNSFDRVFFWMTLHWIDDPEKVLRELARVTRPGGRIYVSALFNLDTDVDLFTRVFDHTLESARSGLWINYNTLSLQTVKRMLDGHVSDFRIEPFEPGIDLVYTGRGLGSRTVRTESGQRLTISGGLLMNWGILAALK